MSAPGGGDRERSFEPWAWVAFLWGTLAALLFVVLGARPGGRLPIVLYRWGPTVLGLVAAMTLFGALAWSTWRRPVFGRRRMVPFIVLALVVWLASYPLPYPSSHANRPSPVRFGLPVEGDWLVRWGGDRRESNALVLDPARRFGLDLVRSEGPEATRGARVGAPAAGRVVVAVGDRPDGEARRDHPTPFGNHLVLAVGPEQFLVLANLEQGSLEVAPGDEVEAGEPLARVGHSALSRVSPLPHLMVHLQDSPRPGVGEGIPMRFHGYEANGRSVPWGAPLGGQTVSAGPSSPQGAGGVR